MFKFILIKSALIMAFLKEKIIDIIKIDLVITRYLLTQPLQRRFCLSSHYTADIIIFMLQRNPYSIKHVMRLTQHEHASDKVWINDLCSNQSLRLINHLDRLKLNKIYCLFKYFKQFTVRVECSLQNRTKGNIV